MDENMQHTEPTTGVFLIFVLIFNSIAHLFEAIQPLLASIAAIAALIVAIMSIVTNWSKFTLQIKKWFKSKE